MQQISLYLDKFKGLLPPDYLIRQAVHDLLKDEFSISLDISNIRVSRSKIIINADSFVKSELFQNQKQIMESLRERLLGYKIDRVG